MSENESVAENLPSENTAIQERPTNEMVDTGKKGRIHGVFEKRKVFFKGLFLGLIGLVVLCGTLGLYLYDKYSKAQLVLARGPEVAYSLEENGQTKDAKRLWQQINAKTIWYQPFYWFQASIDKPWLEMASLAYKAENWTDVATYGFLALQVPITDKQAVAVQQMILTATANLVRAYIPTSDGEPQKGGVPDHAAPLCETTDIIWIVPAIMAVIAIICLYGKMYILFCIVILSMPCYVYGIHKYNKLAVARCEKRLSFNPNKINLFSVLEKSNPELEFYQEFYTEKDKNEIDVEEKKIEAPTE